LTAELSRWAADTWRSLDALTNPSTGLPADNIAAGLAPSSHSRYTSPTNIGGLLWSAVAARELGLIDAAEAVRRCRAAVETLDAMQRDRTSGMFYNWYDEATGARLGRMPTGEPIRQFLSSVDNGWLAAGLLVVRNAVPEVSAAARRLLESMDFGTFHDPVAGELWGGFYADDRGLTASENHYGHLMSEPRIASYLGIAFGQIPSGHYSSLPRGRRKYRGMQVMPTWGGSMFEALMPALLVPEAAWSPVFDVSHRNTVRCQITFGLDEARFGYWGFSPASTPDGGYSEWGLPPIGLAPYEYPCDVERTAFAVGQVSGWGDGVVTPHAVAMALLFEPGAAVECLRRLEGELGCYGPGGFCDAVGVRSGMVARRYLTLDQSMVMAALANVLADGVIQRYCVEGELSERVRPLIEAEPALD